MDALALEVLKAEALEEAGEYRAAAELMAGAVALAHQNYVRSKVPGIVLVRQPTIAKPRREYVERYKARLRVDWQKWDRCSRYAPDRECDGEEDAEDLRASHKIPAAAASGGLGPADWHPETLEKHDAAGESGQVELVHTCCDGVRVAVPVTPHEMAERACKLFNGDPKGTTQKLLSGDDVELCPRACTHDEVARWLLTANQLSKNKIGDYLGRSDDDAQQVLAAFLAPLDFAGFRAFDEALRFFLSLFRLPGEAQQIDRIMQHFAQRYYDAKPGIFRAADTLYVLAFSLIMLNTDAHSDQIEHKMTLQQFLRNTGGIDEGADLPVEMLTSLYHSICRNEIRMEQREFISSVKEGWLHKQGGRVKNWKKRYTILSGNVLYYFKSPKDRAPAGFVPLEGIEARMLPDGRSFELRPKQLDGNMKSVRMEAAGGKRSVFSHGHHKAFRFRVLGATEQAEEWVRAVREHAVAQQVRVKSTRLSHVDRGVDHGGEERGQQSRRRRARSCVRCCLFRSRGVDATPAGAPDDVQHR